MDFRCLGHIFDYLNPNDLINFIKASAELTDLVERSTDEAKRVYETHFANETVCIRMYYKHVPKDGVNVDPPLLRSIRSLRSIESPDDCRMFVNIFGSKIKCLEVDYNGAPIEALNSTNNVRENLEFFTMRPLKNWFPNLKKLTLIDKYSKEKWKKYEFYDAIDYKNMIESAPQLEVLSWTGKISISSLRFINEKQPMLRELNFDYKCHWWKEEGDRGVGEVLFENVEKVSMFMEEFVDPVNFPLKFERLIDLTFGFGTADHFHSFDNENHERVDEWMDFIVEHYNLTRLELNMECTLYEDHLLLLANRLLNLTELTVNVDEVDYDAVDRFFLDFKTLQNIEITFGPFENARSWPWEDKAVYKPYLHEYYSDDWIIEEFAGWDLNIIAKRKSIR